MHAHVPHVSSGIAGVSIDRSIGLLTEPKFIPQRPDHYNQKTAEWLPRASTELYIGPLCPVRDVDQVRVWVSSTPLIYSQPCEIFVVEYKIRPQIGR